MRTTKEDGGPAFPMPGADYTEDCGDFARKQYHGPQHGMSLRDYFAATAMQGLLANPKLYDKIDYVVAHADRVADAMLKARSE